MIKSPCNNICKMDLKNNFCIGCGRSIYQITNWSFYSEKERKKIIKNIKNKFKNITVKKY